MNNVMLVATTARELAMRVRVAALIVLTALVLAGPVSAQSLDVDRIARELEPEILRTMGEGNISSATVALVSGDLIVWKHAYGYSNRWARTEARTDTVYLIGSTFKAMSTVALLQLMEQGKFKLDDRVNDYLSDFKIRNEDPKNPVTFRHLLTHTSGLPADFGPAPLWGDEAPPKLEEYLAAKLTVTGPPLEKEVYSNMAYTLVAYLVQKLSGVPFKRYIEEHIFKPLQMDSTVFAPTPQIEERLSIPYVFDSTKNEFVPTVRLRAAVWPAGIVYGTVTDQANWLIANLNDGVFNGQRIIKKETLDQMMTKQYDKFKGPIEGLWGTEKAGFGLTWWLEQRPDGDHYFAHSGSVPGYTAFLLGDRDRKLGFAVLTNGHQAHKLLFRLADRALELMRSAEKAH
jgi:CubicO group peptidase (beta-lactamase class C family)